MHMQFASFPIYLLSHLYQNIKNTNERGLHTVFVSDTGDLSQCGIFCIKPLSHFPNKVYSLYKKYVTLEF